MIAITNRKDTISFGPIFMLFTDSPLNLGLWLKNIYKKRKKQFFYFFFLKKQQKLM